MTEERWDALVRRLEGVAAERPNAYRVRVGLLAGLGYAYLALVCGALLALAGAVVVAAVESSPLLLKLAIPLVAVAYGVVKALLLRLPEPDGIPLERADAPALWDVVDAVRERLDAPAVDRLLLDSRLNAAAAQVPLHGVLGRQSNYLIVGLPLMQGLTPAQFTAVLAHEFGHLSGNHSRFAGWVYRLRRTYGLVLSTLERSRSRATVLFRRFFDWYSPYFAAYSFALARQDEYAADAVAAEITSAAAAAAGLVRIELAADHLDGSFWPAIEQRLERDAAPPAEVFATLREQVRAELGKEALDRALRAQTGTADTHPALRDRLNALGVAPAQAGAAGSARLERSAAEAFIGAREAALVTRLDAEWRGSVAPTWGEAHDETRSARRRRDELEARPARTAKEELELGLLAARFDGDESALPHMQATLALEPHEPVAAFWVGRAALARGDDAGLEQLKVAMNGDHEAIPHACALAVEHLRRRGRHEEAERYRERASDYESMLEAAHRERVEDMRPGDRFDTHRLDPATTAAVRALLADMPQVKRAYLARKVMRHLPGDHPVFLLGLELRQTARAQKVSAELAQRLELPGGVFVVPLVEGWRRTKRRLRDLPGALVYERG